MRGTIIHWDPAAGSGLISGMDGDRVAFSRAGWRSAEEPQPGREVDYGLPGGTPADIYMLPATAPAYLDTPQSPAERQAMTYAIISLVCGGLGFFFGPLGFLPGIPAIIFGVKGRRMGRDLPDQTASIMSLAGLILGIVVCAIGLLFLAFFVSIFSTVFWLAPPPVPR